MWSGAGIKVTCRGHVPLARITQTLCALQLLAGVRIAVACGCAYCSCLRVFWPFQLFYSQVLLLQLGLNRICCPCVVEANLTLLCPTFSSQLPRIRVDMQLDRHVGSSKDKVLHMLVRQLTVYSTEPG